LKRVVGEGIRRNLEAFGGAIATRSLSNVDFLLLGPSSHGRWMIRGCAERGYILHEAKGLLKGAFGLNSKPKLPICSARKLASPFSSTPGQKP